VFLDVEASTTPVESLSLVARDSAPFRQMVYLEREIRRAEQMASSWSRTLIEPAVTDRGGSGGLRLGLTRINRAGWAFPVADFRIVAVVRGAGLVAIDGHERPIAAHDHFGVPAAMVATLRQTGDAPLVVLDALIQGHARPAPRS